ncbi:MAG: L7Ae/L30e/S12e/Gadd45 family ribosomal protein [Candidatus Heteroscillospira sp.]|jgi:ribosomal protein L7Ae-like RNA K-turn-binding protein
MNKALSYLGLARKAGLLEIGEENTGAALRWGKAKLVLLASDASENARHRAEGFLQGKNTPCVTLPFTKDEISAETGKNGCSMAAFTDIGFAHSFVKALAGDGEEYAEVLEQVSQMKERAAQRRQEAKKHEMNKKFGKRRKNV